LVAGLLALIAVSQAHHSGQLFDGLAVENRAAVRHCAGSTEPSHIDDWIADMNQDGVSPTKVIEAVGVLRRVLDER
jgi:hypothetical protein